MSESDTNNLCPKCHAALPSGLYEGTGTTCPACGLVFSTYRAAQHPAYRITRNHPASTLSQSVAGLLAYLMSVPDSVTRSRCYAGAIGFVIFAFWGITLAMLDYRTGEMSQSFLHGPLLVFHEAGHVIFRLFGDFFTVLGGTLGQLIMPLVLLFALLRYNHDTLGAALALWLFGVSLLDIAPYAYDALTPQLILLNGAAGEEGGHDWIYLLRELGLLKQAHGVGRFFYVAGVAALLVATLWAGALLRKQWRTFNGKDVY